MGERTISVTCRDCGSTFTHQTKSNRPKLLCAACVKESQRRANRESVARRREAAKAVRPPRLCLECPTDISAEPPRALRCIPCRKTKRREEQRSLRAANPVPPQVSSCAECGSKIVRIGKSGTATYCPGCVPIARKRNQRRSDMKARERRGTTLATHCHYCGVKFDKPRFRAKTPNRCEECKKDRHRTYIRAYYAKQPRGYDHVRRARKMGLGYERFTVMEIFERDRWKCGICRKRISRRLRYPNPLSASLDHKVPLGKGGHHSRLNTQAAHLRCNLRKRTAPAPMGEQIPLPI